MDGSAFDALARSAATVAGRRAVAAALAGGLLGLARVPGGGRVAAKGKDKFQKQCDAWTARCAGGVDHMCAILYPPASRPTEYADCASRCGGCCDAGTCASSEDVAFAKNWTGICLDLGCPARSAPPSRNQTWT